MFELILFSASLSQSFLLTFLVPSVFIVISFNSHMSSTHIAEYNDPVLIIFPPTCADLEKCHVTSKIM